MADSSIGALPQAPQLDDDSLLVAEQQGQAMKVTGAQFKEFGRQAVIGQVQSYVDAARAAAAQAAEAVSAVTEMTVEAHASDTATVTKSTRAGKVNLDFGLPRGEKGEPGPAGETGPRGPQGPPGNGLTLLGHYNTEDALRAAVASPEVGDAYSVGLEPPYDVYVFDGATLDWKNYGPLSGGGGGSILPENAVTTPGGAELEFSSGDGPHTVTFDFEEEPPLTAGDIVYGDGTVQDAISELFTSGSEGKTLIASAVTAKGVETAADASFAELAANIRKIQTGGDTSDATATPGDILAPKTAYTASGKVEGIIPSLPAQTITPGTADKTIANGQYLAGTQTIKGDPNLTSSNIKKGVSIFGVSGAMESSFQATLTVKADIGAVVTATCGDTSVEALSTTGTVVLELPIEGTWKVTAVRGMAQYNTATIVVSSQYSAELTAEVFIEYYKTATPLNAARDDMLSASVGNYALFAGGIADGYYSAIVEAYNTSLTRSTPMELNVARVRAEATTVGDFALFAGGTFVDRDVDAYNSDLTHSSTTPLSTESEESAAATVGSYALIAGGKIDSNNVGTRLTSTVNAYDANLTRGIVSSLSKARTLATGVTVGNYALIAGGNSYTGSSSSTPSSIYYSDVVDAYNTALVRSTPIALKFARENCASASVGNYALIAGGYILGTTYPSDVTAYDANLTQTTPTPLSSSSARGGATSVGGYALIGNNSSYGYVDVYDEVLTRTTQEVGLSVARREFSAATVGAYALFAGGASTFDNSRCDTVDVYRRV